MRDIEQIKADALADWLATVDGHEIFGVEVYGLLRPFGVDHAGGKLHGNGRSVAAPTQKRGAVARSMKREARGGFLDGTAPELLVCADALALALCQLVGVNPRRTFGRGSQVSACVTAIRDSVAANPGGRDA
jgi:hypothetical protein